MGGLSRLSTSFSNHPQLCVFTVGLYILSILTGLFFKNRLPVKCMEFIRNGDAKKTKQTENIFGKYHERVKSGNFLVMLKCTGIVFGFNTSGALMNTVMNIFVLPIVLTMLYSGVLQGISFTEIKKGSTRWSVLLYCIVGGLEWITYPLSNYAGLLITSAILSSIIYGITFGSSIVTAGIDVISVYAIIVVLLLIQAPLELLYVRKVLKSGGSGIPLKPY